METTDFRILLRDFDETIILFFFFSKIILKMIALFPNEKLTIREETFKFENLIKTRCVQFGLKA